MGAWGYGPMDNDRALDLRSEAAAAQWAAAQRAAGSARRDPYKLAEALAHAEMARLLDHTPTRAEYDAFVGAVSAVMEQEARSYNNPRRRLTAVALFLRKLAPVSRANPDARLRIGRAPRRRPRATARRR